jgi:hypothetical protein
MISITPAVKVVRLPKLGSSAGPSAAARLHMDLLAQVLHHWRRTRMLRPCVQVVQGRPAQPDLGPLVLVEPPAGPRQIAVLGGRIGLLGSPVFRPRLILDGRGDLLPGARCGGHRHRLRGGQPGAAFLLQAPAGVGTTPRMGDHTECVRVTFDPGLVTFPALLSTFLRSHDPTAKQPRCGGITSRLVCPDPEAPPRQYRSLVVAQSSEQVAQTRAALSKVPPAFRSVPMHSGTVTL